MGITKQVRQVPVSVAKHHLPAATEQSFEFAWIEDAAALRGLEDDWIKLENESATPLSFFQSFLWVSTWWHHFEETGRFRLRVLAARSRGKLVLVWPTVIAKRGSLKLLEPAGGSLSCFSNALIANDPQREEWLAKALRLLRSVRGVDGIHFGGVHEHSAIHDLMISESEDVVAWGASPEVSLDSFENFDSFLQSRSKGFRKEIRSCRRQLERIGPVCDRMNDPEITPREAVESILAFKRDWIRDQKLQEKTILSGRGEAFLSDFCEKLELGLGIGELMVNSLSIDDRLVACGIAFSYGGQQLEYIGGFEHSLRANGAGKVQLSCSVAHAIECGRSICNLLTPTTEFKLRWTDDLPEVVQVFIPVSLRGRLYRDVYLKRLRPRIKQLYHSAKAMVAKW